MRLNSPQLNLANANCGHLHSLQLLVTSQSDPAQPNLARLPLAPQTADAAWARGCVRRRPLPAPTSARAGAPAGCRCVRPCRHLPCAPVRAAMECPCFAGGEKGGGRRRICFP